MSAAAVGAAARSVGLPGATVELLRAGSNELYRLPGGIVARLGRAGGGEVARREVAVATWLRGEGIDAVEPVEGVPQPTTVDAGPITWWRELPPHRHATPAELGGVLARLHRLHLPSDVARPPDLDPFTGTVRRIDGARLLDPADRSLLAQRLEALRGEWPRLLADAGPHSVVHGDAWQGNVAATADGRLVLLDFEHVAIGPNTWDLAGIAVDHTDFGRVDRRAYESFVTAYGGTDVTTDMHYRLLADLWLFRWTAFAIMLAAENPSARSEAAHRVRCLLGDVPRPWTWHAL